MHRDPTLRRRVAWWFAALGFALIAAVGATPIARAAECTQSDVVVYTGADNNGPTRIAPELAKFPTTCVEYYVTIPPITAAPNQGFPRGAPQIDTVHTSGLHALAEIRLNPWAARVGTGDWYAAGVQVRQLMAAAGYDVASGDTWAINEVGAPTTQTMGADVMRNVGNARDNFRDFVRGLYDGGGPPSLPSPGVVFAANPVHVATDLAQYRTELADWYADSEFWQDMDDYVRLWAQETYADARTWGVPGSTLADRAAYLDDYSLHGIRLAQFGGDSTKAARDFFAKTYTPIGNASFRQPAPPPAGIGFGYTEISLATMLNFVSSQTYALRSSSPARFGFADAPRLATFTTVPERVAVDQRMADAIQDSETDPGGACGAAGEWCDSEVAGAAFTGLWRELGNPTAPMIVPHVDGQLGNDGWYTGDVTVTWSVTDLESPVSETVGCEPTVINADTAGTTLTCTATSFGATGSVEVTVKRDATAPTVECEPTPTTLWPPNHRLVPVSVALTIDDETSGPGAFALTETSSSDSGAGNDIRGFVPGEPDVEGLLRAERRPASDGRSYVLTYVAHDAAGNAAGCAATVVVPHDQGD